jgi:hypothetical protein
MEKRWMGDLKISKLHLETGTTAVSWKHDISGNVVIVNTDGGISYTLPVEKKNNESLATSNNHGCVLYSLAVDFHSIYLPMVLLISTFRGAQLPKQARLKFRWKGWHYRTDEGNPTQYLHGPTVCFKNISATLCSGFRFPVFLLRRVLYLHDCAHMDIMTPTRMLRVSTFPGFRTTVPWTAWMLPTSHHGSGRSYNIYFLWAVNTAGKSENSATATTVQSIPDSPDISLNDVSFTSMTVHMETVYADKNVTGFDVSWTARRCHG